MTGLREGDTFGDFAVVQLNLFVATRKAWPLVDENSKSRAIAQGADDTCLNPYQLMCRFVKTPQGNLSESLHWVGGLFRTGNRGQVAQLQNPSSNFHAPHVRHRGWEGTFGKEVCYDCGQYREYISEG
jgi:hypothetical protein